MNEHLSTSALFELLDGELSPVERLRAEAHLVGCARCTSERVRIQALFHRLATLPLLEPSAGLESRILGAVLPGLRARAARRARVWRFVGGLYAAGTAASLVAVASLFVVPQPRAWAHEVAAAATHALAGAFVFVCRSINAAVLSLAGGASLLESAGARLSPFVRVLARVLEIPEVSWLVGGALLAGVVLLWWVRPRADRAWKEGHHVGVLAA